MSTLIIAIDTILMVIWVLYIFISFVNRRWNNFLYGVSLVLLIISKIPFIPFIILLISIIILHRYIAKKELESQTEEDTKQNQ
jgi:predicted membrane protein